MTWPMRPKGPRARPHASSLVMPIGAVMVPVTLATRAARARASSPVVAVSPADPDVEARPAPARLADDGRPETSHERLDRNLVEMTGELRVAITGVQVLFAFLLIVPFDARFAQLTAFERGVYFATLQLAALAAVCTIAPAVQHRILFRHNDKAHLVFSGSALALAGLGFLALAMCGALLLVDAVLFGEAVGVIGAAAMGVPFGILWFAIPLRRRGRGTARASGRPAPGP